MNPLINFYEEAGTDQSGRTFNGIILLNDESLEKSHDFIQWLFPTTQKSAFNKQTPVINDEVVERFNTDKFLIHNFRRAVQRIRSFLDLTSMHPRWMHRGNHNCLRVTRILTSCNQLGFHNESTALYYTLRDIDTDESKVGSVTWNHWSNAYQEKCLYPLKESFTGDGI